MKRFQQWVFIFGLALAGQARAAEGGAPAAEAGKAANIEGKVIIAGTGQPLSGVKLRWLMTNDTREPVLSGPDGAFRLTNIAPGRAAITAVFPGELVADWVAEDLLLTLAPGQTLEVYATNPSVSGDLPAWCRLSGHALVKHEGDFYLIQHQ